MADQFSSLDSGIVAPSSQNRLIEGWDLERALRNITCPTLLMRRLGSRRGNG
jgi:hypothetical protein